MKIIDNTPLREQEKASMLNPIKALQERAAAAKKREEEERSLIVSVTCDWRILGELSPLTAAIWHFDENELRRQFLRKAINNRKSLDELIIEPFEPTGTDLRYNTINIAYDKETIKTLSDEARKHRMSMNDYAQAILYTTALKENNARKEMLKQKEAEQEELKTFSFEGRINQELRRKLMAKFYDPATKRDGLTPFNAGADYGKFLVNIANEYFGIEGGKK